MLALLQLIVVAWLPGAAAFRLPLLDRDRRAGLDAEERVFWAVVTSVALSLSLVVAMAGAWRAVRRRGAQRTGVARGLGIPLLVASSVLALSTPLWLSNWIWHGSPLYPMLRDVFTGSGSSPSRR